MINVGLLNAALWYIYFKYWILLIEVMMNLIFLQLIIKLPWVDIE